MKDTKCCHLWVYVKTLHMSVYMFSTLKHTLRATAHAAVCVTLMKEHSDLKECGLSPPVCIPIPWQRETFQINENFRNQHRSINFPALVPKGICTYNGPTLIHSTYNCAFDIPL